MPQRIPLDFDRIRSLGVKDIRDITAYNISVDQGKTTHNITFYNGGTLVVSFDDRQGKFDAKTSELDAYVSKNGCITLYPNSPST